MDEMTVGLDRDHLADIVARARRARAKPVPAIDPEEQAPRFRIRVEHKQGRWPSRTYEFEQARVTFGRAKDNDVVLPSAWRILSRHHVEIQYHDRSYWLVDKHSRNATRVAGHKIEPAERYVLLDGDSFEVGDTLITFENVVGGG